MTVDEKRRRWLDQLASACEQVLAEQAGDRTDAAYALFREDVSGLLGRIQAELAAAAHC